jgi:preprotein translocase subunit SecG
MIAVLLVIHCMVSLALIGVVLVQKSEGGGLGIGGGNMSGFMSGRGQANLLTRATSILALMVVVTCVSLTIMSGRSHAPTGSVLDSAVPVPAGQAPDAKPQSPAPAAPAAPEQPAPPVAK